MSKVLIVDDAPANRKILAALLTRAGHEALTAAGVDEALEICAREKPVCVLTDLHMATATDGLVLARQLRARTDVPCPRIALMSGDAVTDDATRELFDAILEKPVGFEDLCRFIGEAES